MRTMFKTTAATIAAILMVSACSIATFADSDVSYSQYFSTEEEWVDESLKYDGIITVEDDSIFEKTPDGEVRLVYKAESPIKEMYAGDELIYFSVGQTVYRLFRPDGTVDNIFSNSEMVHFRPVSNSKIEYTTYTSDAIEYMDNGGDLYDEDAPFSLWEQPYIYNVITETSTEQELVNTYGEIVKARVGYKINGKSVPLNGYEVGVYLNNLGGPCTHHTTTDNTNCNWDGSCGCRYIGGGIQCAGFAKYVYKELFGDYSSGTQFGAKSTSDAAKAKSVLQGLRKGARITGNGHTMIMVATDSTYVTVYHANYSSPCMVNTMRFKYADFAKRFPSITGYNPSV